MLRRFLRGVWIMKWPILCVPMIILFIEANEKFGLIVPLTVTLAFSIYVLYCIGKHYEKTKE